MEEGYASLAIESPTVGSFSIDWGKRAAGGHFEMMDYCSRLGKTLDVYLDRHFSTLDPDQRPSPINAHFSDCASHNRLAFIVQPIRSLPKEAGKKTIDRIFNYTMCWEPDWIFH